MRQRHSSDAYSASATVLSSVTFTSPKDRLCAGVHSVSAHRAVQL